MRLALDTGVLGAICHPKRDTGEARWFYAILAGMPPVHEFVLPEVADYELRREFLLNASVHALARLDALPRVASYLPLTTEAMRLAARFWADRRRVGKPGARPGEIDGDVILAAQAALAGATVVTANTRHFERLVATVRWQEILVASSGVRDRHPLHAYVPVPVEASVG